MRWSPPARQSRPAAIPPRVFAALENLAGAKGRLELRRATQDGAPIFVDYAHKPDALAKALEALRPYVSDRLVVVFGCRRRPRRRQAAADGRHRGGQGRPCHRHRRQSAQRRPRRHPRRHPGRRAPAPSKSATAARRSARPSPSLKSRRRPVDRRQRPRDRPDRRRPSIAVQRPRGGRGSARSWGRGLEVNSHERCRAVERRRR